MEKKLYHYTSIMHLKNILISDKINCATANVPKGEKPAVWLSSNTDFEKTAVKGISKEWMIKILGLARIEVKSSDRILTYAKFKHKSGIDPNIAKWLEIVAKKQGANPNEWYTCFNPIKRKDWVAIEVYNSKTKKWESVDKAVRRAAA